MSKKKAMHWPYGIALSFVLVIALVVGTIMVAGKNKVENSDLYMNNYHQVDENANAIMMAQIAFNGKYDLRNLSTPLNAAKTVIAYGLSDKAGNPVTDAAIEVVITRPDTHDHDMTLLNPNNNGAGVFTFEPVSLPLEGRWNVMAKITIGSDYRYYNIKGDTRTPETSEY